MSNFDEKIENAANRIESAANNAWKSARSAYYANPYPPWQKSA